MKLILPSLFFLFSIIILSCNKPTNSEENNKIIPCSTIDDCSSGLDCINGFCKKEDTEECINDDDCPRNSYCNSEAKCQKKTCSSNGDCVKGKICVNTECIEGCISNSDCKDNKMCNIETNKCETKQDCRIDNNCKLGYECDQISGECITKSTCTIQDDCAEGYKCENSKCIAKLTCQTDEECSDGEICRSNGYCDIDSGCDSNQYCIDKNPDKPACNMNSGICYECIKNENCTDNTKPYCNTLRHICQSTESDDICMTDSDCGINKRCDIEVSPHECVDMLETCTSDSDCQNSKHCDTTNGVCVMCLNDSQCTEAGSTCNLNTKTCEGPCLGIFCSNHGDCIYNESDNSVLCDCDENYYADGLYCIYDTHNCIPDQLSEPLNANSETARLIDFGSYDNLTLGNSNCGYVEDWYKINLNTNTKINVNVAYTEVERNVSIKLYKEGDFDNPVKSNTSPSDGLRALFYNAIEENTYYIRVLIYFTSEQKNISYSMVVESN